MVARYITHIFLGFLALAATPLRILAKVDFRSMTCCLLVAPWGIGDLGDPTW